MTKLSDEAAQMALSEQGGKFSLKGATFDLKSDFHEHYVWGKQYGNTQGKLNNLLVYYLSG